VRIAAMDKKMQEGCRRVAQAMLSDYYFWCERQGRESRSSRQEMVVEFMPGRNYIRVVKRFDTINEDGTVYTGSRSCSGFIVKKATGKFEVGDLLKSAGWKSPATNFARGNIDDPKLNIPWTGII